MYGHDLQVLCLPGEHGDEGTGKNIKDTKALFLDTFVASLLLPLSLHY